jgi:hypothetical protein
LGARCEANTSQACSHTWQVWSDGYDAGSLRSHGAQRWIRHHTLSSTQLGQLD